MVRERNRQGCPVIGREAGERSRASIFLQVENVDEIGDGFRHDQQTVIRGDGYLAGSGARFSDRAGGARYSAQLAVMRQKETPDAGRASNGIGGALSLVDRIDHAMR